MAIAVALTGTDWALGGITRVGEELLPFPSIRVVLDQLQDGLHCFLGCFSRTADDSECALWKTGLLLVADLDLYATLLLEYPDGLSRFANHHPCSDIGHKELEVAEILVDVICLDVGGVSSQAHDTSQSSTDVGNCTNDDADATGGARIELPPR